MFQSKIECEKQGNALPLKMSMWNKKHMNAGIDEQNEREKKTNELM